MANTTTPNGGGVADLNSITALLDSAENILIGINNAIQQDIRNSFLDNIPGTDYVAQQLQAQIRNAESVLSTIGTAIQTQIAPIISAAGGSAIGSLLALAENFLSGFDTLISNIATTEDVVTSAIATLKQHAPELSRWLFENVTSGFGSVALSVLKEMETQDAAGINETMDALLAIPNAPSWFTTLATGFRNRGAEWQALALPAILGAILFSAIAAMTEPFATAVKQGAYDQLPTKEAEPPTLVDALMRGLITPERFAHGMRQQGYNADVATLAFQVREELLDPDVLTRAYVRGEISEQQWQESLSLRGIDAGKAKVQLGATLNPINDDDLRNAYLRGIIPAAEHDSALARLGWESNVAALRRQLYFYIPPVADLIHMGIRNVFTPEIVKRFNLDGDYPQAFEKAATQQGVSPEWSHKYWQSHWIMPGRDAFFEMFQRTVDKPLDPSADTIELSDGTKVHNIMGRDTLNLALRDIDTPPFYRDKLTEIAYHPLTRIDIRRMASVGALDHAGVERAYLDLGYNQKHARQLADFTDTLNAKAKKDEAATLIDGMRRQVLRLYERGRLSAEQANHTLTELGFTDKEITSFVAEVDLVQSSENAAALENAIGKLYVAGIITDKDAIKRMQANGVPVDAQSLLFQKWDMEIEYRGGTQHLHQHRELTKGEVLTAFVDKLIPVATAKTMLRNLGYDEAGTNAEISLALYKSQRADKTAKVDAIKASYINGTIEELEASNRLDALQIPSDQRDAYLSVWTLQRETRTERIPLATLRDMVKGDYITTEELMVHLKRHRFTDTDAALLIKFWTAQPPPKRLVNVSGT